MKLKSQLGKQRNNELIKLRKQIINLKEPIELELQSFKAFSKDMLIDPLIGVYILQDGKFESINAQCEELTGYNDAELLGMEWLKLVVPDDRELVLSQSKKAINGECSTPYEYRVLTKDGKIRWVSEIVTPINYQGKRATLGYFMDITDSKEAEKDLDYFSSAIQDSVDSILISDIDYKIIDVNDATLKLYGTSDKSDLIGKKSVDIIVPKDRKRAMQNLEQVLKKGDRHEREYDIVIKDGSKIPVEVNAAVMKDNAQNPIGFIGVVRDLSERKRMKEALKKVRHEVEQAIVNRTSELKRASNKLKLELVERKSVEATLRESEKKYATLVEKGNDGIVIIKDGILKFANSKIRALTGFSVKEAIGKSFIEFVSPKYRDLVIDNYRRRLAGKRIPARYEIELISKGGQEIPVEINGALIEYEGGEADIAIIRDITERKRVEVALKESEERYRLISELTSDFIFRLNIAQDGQIELDSISTGFKWANKYNLDNILNPKTGYKSIYPDDLKSFQSFIQTVIFEGVSNELEFRVYVKSNKIVWLHVIAQPLLSHLPKRVTTVLGAVKDITERKLAEEKIQSLNEDLQHHTVQLEAVNKDLERFSYSISQDIRATLKAIDGSLRILLKNDVGQLDEKGQHLFNVIEYSSKVLGQMVDNLINFSKMGGRELIRSEINMDELVKIIIEDLKTTTPSRPVSFKVKSLPPSQGDQIMIRQVLINLLSNAIKFSKYTEHASIEIGGRVKKSENLYYIRDNGVGFNIMHADELFDVFKKLHSQDEFEGTGIGLTIVKRIITQHGGRVWAEGKVNKGATFYFTLPRGKDE